MRKEKNRLIEMKLHIYQDKTPVNCFSFQSCSDFFSSRNNWLTCCRSARRLTMQKGSNILQRNIWHFFCKIIFVYISYLTIYLSINFSNYLSLYVYTYKIVLFLSRLNPSTYCVFVYKAFWLVFIFWPAFLTISDTVCRQFFPIMIKC